MPIHEARNILALMLDENADPHATFHGTLNEARAEALATLLDATSGLAG